MSRGETAVDELLVFMKLLALLPAGFRSGREKSGRGGHTGADGHTDLFTVGIEVFLFPGAQFYFLLTLPES